MGERKKTTSPIFFMEEGKEYRVNPIYMIDETINTRDKFAILRTTDNGKWVRGGMLYYKLNGIEIYTDINNVLFVDLKSNLVFVKEYEKVVEQITPVDPEKRQYIILMVNNTPEGETYTWESMIGRTEIYHWITDNIDIYDFNPIKSIVLTENVPYKDALTVSQFIKYLQNGQLVEEDGFDIDEYCYYEDQE